MEDVRGVSQVLALVIMFMILTSIAALIALNYIELGSLGEGAVKQQGLLVLSKGSLNSIEVKAYIEFNKSKNRPYTLLIELYNPLPRSVEVKDLRLIYPNGTILEVKGKWVLDPKSRRVIEVKLPISLVKHEETYMFEVDDMAPGDVYLINLENNNCSRIVSGIVFWDDFTKNTYEELWFDDNIVPVYDPMDLGSPTHYRDEDLRFEDGVLTISTGFYKEHAELRSPLITLGDNYVIVTRLRYPSGGHKYPLGFYVGSKREYFGVRFSEKDDKIYLFESSSKQSRILTSLDLTNNWYIVVYDHDAKRLILGSDNGEEYVSSPVSVDLNSIYLWLGQAGMYRKTTIWEEKVKYTPWRSKRGNSLSDSYRFRIPDDAIIKYVWVYLTFEVPGQYFVNPSGRFKVETISGDYVEDLLWWGKVDENTYAYGGATIWLEKKASQVGYCRVNARWDNVIWFAYYFGCRYKVKKTIKQPQKEIMQADYIGVFKSKYITLNVEGDNVKCIKVYGYDPSTSEWKLIGMVNGDLGKILLPVNWLKVFKGRIEVYTYNEEIVGELPLKVELNVLLGDSRLRHELLVNKTREYPHITPCLEEVASLELHGDVVNSNEKVIFGNNGYVVLDYVNITKANTILFNATLLSLDGYVAIWMGLNPTIIDGYYIASQGFTVVVKCDKILLYNGTSRILVTYSDIRLSQDKTYALEINYVNGVLALYINGTCVLAKALNLKLEPSWNTGISGRYLKVVKPICYCNMWYSYTSYYEP